MHRLLLAIDLTEGSQAALARAVQLAAAQSAVLEIVHAHPRVVSDYEISCRHSLDEQMRRLPRGLDLEYSLRLVAGDPETVILDEAERFDPDLITMGAHGEPRLRDAVFGTTAMHVMHRARHPVLVARNQPMEPYRKVMLGVEDAASVDETLRISVNIAPRAELFAVHAFMPSMKESLSGEDVGARLLRDQQEMVRNAAQRRVPAGAGHEIFILVEKGDVMSVLERAYERLRPDLVVLATHGRTGPDRIVRGSYADDMILWCEADLLLSRLHAGEEQAAA